MKRLPRTTVCTLYKINKPVWNGNVHKRVVGLAEYRLTKHNEVEFTACSKKTGLRYIPDHYYFNGDLKNEYPRQVVKGGMTLVLIPIAELEVLERVKPTKVVTDPKEMPLLISKIFFKGE